MTTTTTDATALSASVLSRLEAAWNAADGQAFGAEFSDDADFVDVRGDHHTGRMAIAMGHQGIFSSIYKGSHNEYTLIRAKNLAPTVIYAVASGTMENPAGPMEGTHHTTFSMLLVEEESGWKLAAFHNTLVAPEGTPGREESRS